MATLRDHQYNLDDPAEMELGPWGTIYNPAGSTLSAPSGGGTTPKSSGNATPSAPSTPVAGAAPVNVSGQPHSAANHPFSNPVSNNWAPLWGDQAQGGLSPSRASSAPRTPYGTVNESRTIYEGVAPEFSPPEYDEGEVRKRSKKLAAPALRKMEMAVSQSLSKYYENPNVRSTTVRDTLAGYGMGLGEVLTKAESQAQQQYGAEHARLFSESMTKYNAAMLRYMSSARQVQTQRQTYTAAGFEAAASGAPATSSLNYKA